MNTRQRLENWALWVICKGKAGNTEDAQNLDDAIFMLNSPDKELLVTVFTHQVSHDTICRRLGIPIRPASLFVEAFNRAEKALEAELKEIGHGTVSTSK